MTLSTRRPTGTPPWPILLVAGRQKSGKSWACAVASASPLIGRTLWVSIGELDPDEYGRIPGVDFEIVEGTTSYAGIVTAIAEVASLPPGDLPTLLVVDSMTRLWEMLSENAQSVANARARRNNNGVLPSYEIVITQDLWNRAKAQWATVMKAIRAHNGPVILTARLDAVSVVENGKPTKERAEKVKGEKGLPYDVDGVIEMPERGTAYLSGVRSTVLQLSAKQSLPDFSFHELWQLLGLEDNDVAPRAHSETETEQPTTLPADATSAG